MKRQSTLLNTLAGFMLCWGITFLALEGSLALFNRFFTFTEGAPKLPMVLSVACAMALGLQVARRRVADPAEPPAEPLNPEKETRPTPRRAAAEAPSLAATDAFSAARPEELPLAEVISRSIDLQLELIRQAFSLTTVALLWPAPDEKSLELCNIATVHRHIERGPFPIGAGITGALSKGTGEIAIAPLRSGCSGLPYYGAQDNAGSLFLAKLPKEPLKSSACASDRPGGILCIDRTSAEPWSDAERQALCLAARRLALDVSIGERLYALDQEGSVIRQLCMGMHELNQGLGLESAFDATIKAVKTLVPADFIAISLVEEKTHSTLIAEGAHAEKIQGGRYPLNEGLVGQVIKFNRPLPEGGEYQGASPVFSSQHLFSDFRSLLIVPLRKDGEAPIGALTVASKKPGIFDRSQQSILQLIATQVAIKIDLAQSHERINRMAITDSLTGLANHRAFRTGFEVMLNRAQRREGPLALLLCDVDHFKGINDRYGHPFGDQVLKKVAEVLGNTVRVVDLAARYGGEEFVVVLEDSNNEGARFMAERLRSQIEEITLPFQSMQVKVTISIGYALYPENGTEMQSLIDRADEALYKAKKNGRNRVEKWVGTQAKTA